jgi:hypothetical protein
MFSSLTTTGAINAAGDWAAELGPILLVVVGFGVAIFIANWIYRKFKSGRVRRKKRG